MEITPRVFLKKYRVLHRTSSINGLPTHWVEYGAGKPMLCLHGAGGAWTDFWSLLPAIKNRRCIIVDLPGCGKTGALKDYSLKNQVAWLSEFVKYTCKSKPDIDAICSSSLLAFEYMDSNKVDNLILHMPVVDGRWADAETKSRGFFLNFMTPFALKLVSKAPWVMKNLINMNENETIIESARLDYENKKRCDLNGLIFTAKSSLSARIAGKLKNFNGNLLVLATDKDSITPAHRLKEFVPNKSLKVFSNVHSWNKELIVWQNKEVLNFLKR